MSIPDRDREPGPPADLPSPPAPGSFRTPPERAGQPPSPYGAPLGGSPVSPQPGGGTERPPYEPAGMGYDPRYGYYSASARPPASRRQQRSALGWLGGAGAILLGGLKYVAALGPVAKTLLSLALSFGVYAVFGGWAFAGALVVMILLHELGHVAEIRHQGMPASAPIFIPFFGAAIFMRSHAQDALKQARIAIAGPLAGTAAAVAAYVLYGATGQPFFLFAAYLGFFLNLFNLIPFGMLDGGWVLAVASKWFQIAGIVILVVVALLGHLSAIFILFAVLSVPSVIARFRNDDSAYYQSVPVTARWGMAAAWLVLVVFLGFAFYQTHNELNALIR